MNLDFIEPLSRSIDIINTASRITKIINLLKTVTCIVAVSLIFVNVIGLVKQQT